MMSILSAGIRAPGEYSRRMAVHRRSVRFGPDNGTLLLRTRRAGLASRIGHDLTIEVTSWSAEFELADPADPSGGGRIVATMDLASLAVREGVGGAVPLTERDVQEIEGNARRILDVGRHPTATFGADRITLSATGGAISGMLAFHGTRAAIVLEVREVAPHRWEATVTVRQTAFGIKPYSAFLGALKLRDEVEIACLVDFDASRTSDPISS
jgi:polyisoprenoid-binding protein YceI